MNQAMYVKWGNCLSDAFTVTSKVRQDRQSIFTIFLEVLSVHFGFVKDRCTDGNMVANMDVGKTFSSGPGGRSSGLFQGFVKSIFPGGQ